MSDSLKIGAALLAVGLEVVNHLDDQPRCQSIKEIGQALDVHSGSVASEAKRTFKVANIDGGPLVSTETTQDQGEPDAILRGIVDWMMNVYGAIERCTCPRGEWRVSANWNGRMAATMLSKVLANA